VKGFAEGGAGGESAEREGFDDGGRRLGVDGDAVVCAERQQGQSNETMRKRTCSVVSGLEEENEADLNVHVVVVFDLNVDREVFAEVSRLSERGFDALS
jgi:hypothetical protein